MLKNETNIKLYDSMFKYRYDLNRKYVMKLKTENLLQNHYLEAGLWTPWGETSDCHKGWEFPTGSVKGQFLGHWMSAAAKMYAFNNDFEAKAKLDVIIEELEKCQKENGGEWVNSNPIKYLEWALKGRLVGVPHYVIHKTMMGLWDSYEFAGSEKALEILLKFTNFFIKFTKNLSVDEMDNLLDFETGGMMEILANIYGLTREKKHLDLMKKYERRRLFIPLSEGKDMLSNMHANTTVPEILGAARAYEVTGEEKYLEYVHAYWECAVTKRSYYSTGGANSGEIWCPNSDFSSRLGAKTQEHCTQYNMIRLAEFLFRHTDDLKYQDFIERSLYNGVFAQQNPITGMVAYYLPLEPGSEKIWGTETETFWCCHGSLVQAHTNHQSYMFYSKDDTIMIAQYIPSEVKLKIDETDVSLKLQLDNQGGQTQSVVEFDSGSLRKPNSVKYKIYVDSSSKCQFELKLRLPWWIRGVNATLNGEKYPCDLKQTSYLCIKKTWNNDIIEIEFEKSIEAIKIPDDNDLYSFMDGPVVLAGLINKETSIKRGNLQIEKLFRPIDARHWGQWREDYITVGQEENIKFKPIYNITDEKYTVYFRLE